MRYWVILSNLGQMRIGPENEGHLAKVFVDTGANCNTISRTFYEIVVSQGLKCAFYPGPSKGVHINLIGGQVLNISGDRVLVQTEVGTNLGHFHSDQEFMVLGNDVEDLVMGVKWFNAIHNVSQDDHVKILDATLRGLTMENPIEFGQDLAPEDDLLECSNIGVFPDLNSEAWESCTFNPDFPDLDRLKEIVKLHGNVLFQPFDQEGLRVEPLRLKVNPAAQFRMQPCRFVREGILRPLKELLDQFVSEGVLVSDNSCDFASPLVIVNKKDGGIRMAVDYREVNLQLETTANQLPYQPTLFQCLGGQTYFAKVDNLWGYHQLKLAENSSKVTAIITPWGVYRFLACPFGISTAPGEYQARMAHVVLKDFYLNGAIVYIDDTVIYGRNVEDFLGTLDRILSQMSKFNVRLKPSKCFLE